MPQFVEDIVACHIEATQRDREGRPRWDGQLEFMSVIRPLAERLGKGDDTLTAQELLDGFRAVAKEIRDKVPQAQSKFFEAGDDDLEHFVLTLEQEWSLNYIEMAEEIFDEFDELLERLYDWGDRNRWFIKP